MRGSDLGIAAKEFILLEDVFRELVIVSDWKKNFEVDTWMLQRFIFNGSLDHDAACLAIEDDSSVEYKQKMQ
jgi:hypothetical protein